MKLSRDWLGNFVDLSGVSDEALAQRMTEIGHAVEAVDRHGQDTVFDVEITTNRVDVMSHFGMARELAAALGRNLVSETADQTIRRAPPSGPGVVIHVEAPEMCGRYSGLVIRGVTVKPSPEVIRQRLEAVGLRPINNIVDVTNYVMLSLGHPLHAFDLDRIARATIIVRRGLAGESMKSLDGAMRTIDPETVVIADANGAVALGGIIGGAESEISASTRNVLLECAWFNPSVIRRSARRLGIKTDASYRFERRVDPNDTLTAIDMAADLIVHYGGGHREDVIDVVAAHEQPKKLRLRSAKLHEASAGVVGEGYALELFRRLGFEATAVSGAIDVIVPTYRGDLHEEMDLVEEVLRFYGLDKVPSVLPRLTTGDARANTIGEAEDAARAVLAGCGLSEVVNYSFIHSGANSSFSDEEPVAISNALSENVAAMRLSLLPGILDSVVYNRSYGTRDAALFEIGRTYHRAGDGVREQHRAAVVMVGSIGSHWGETERVSDFFDLKGIVEQLAARWHVGLTFDTSDAAWLKSGKRSVARNGERVVATLGALSSAVLQRFDLKGEVMAAEIDLEAILAATTEWKMAAVARHPGVPMVLGLIHSPELSYQRIVETIRSLNVPHLHEVGLRDRFVPAGGENAVKTTLGMWYQAFDRSLTQDEVTASQQKLASTLVDLLPVTLLQGEVK